MCAWTRFSLVLLVLAQKTPYLHCQDYKEAHVHETPYPQIGSQCTYPCECPSRLPRCQPGVTVSRDGCDCCLVCPRQLGESCDSTALCDSARGLVCQFPAHNIQGVCRAIKGLPCTVYNRTYSNGETFLLDCRTQCACQNGTYACASLCPREAISPQGTCRHPRLVEVPGQCCREWMCDTAAADQPAATCLEKASPWSECSTSCGLGLSSRVSNSNPRCEASSESRLCQIRSCGQDESQHQIGSRHRVRKGHECKATQRLPNPVRLRFGPCISRKRFRPKVCGGCGPELCCRPQYSTTLLVAFRCRGLDTALRSPGELVSRLAVPGADLWKINQQNIEDDSRTEEKYENMQEEGDAWPLWRRYPVVELASPLKKRSERSQPVHHNQNRRSRRPRFTDLSVNVQWVLKCVCEPCSLSESSQETRMVTGKPPVLLHRVHRTAAP